MILRLFATLLVLPTVAVALEVQQVELSLDQDPPPDPLISEASLVRVGKPGKSPSNRTLLGLPYSAGLELRAGYDSNVILAAKDNSDLASNAHSATLGATLRGSLTLVSGEKGTVMVGGDTGYNANPSVHSADLARLGGYVTGYMRIKSLTVGVNGGATRYQETSPAWDGAANVGYGTVFFSYETKRHIVLATFGLTKLNLDSNENSSGVRFDASPRWWLLFEESIMSRRLELITRYTRMAALADYRSYRAGVLGAGIVYRFGEKQTAGTIDMDARIGHEWRIYDTDVSAAEREQQRLLSATGNLDWWLSSWVSIGPYLGLEHRVGSPQEFVNYDRWYAGLRSHLIF